MRLLLDTHAFVWWALESRRLPTSCKEAIEKPDSTVLISAAVVWEMSIKHAGGKWDEVGAVLASMSEVFGRGSFEQLAISLEHARAAGSLPGPHKDPFDRMLIAQAMAEDAVIVSADRVFAAYPVPVLWP